MEFVMEIDVAKGYLNSLKKYPLLSADEEIVRTKIIEFPPLTQEEALIEIDLLGHDFYAYTDRDSGAACVLYRRNGGGYGLLMQKE